MTTVSSNAQHVNSNTQHVVSGNLPQVGGGSSRIKGTRCGRPSKPYRMANGREVHGLYRRPDGRWRIVGTNTIFTEHDENRAVHRFQQMTRDKTATVTIPVVTAGAAEKIESEHDEPNMPFEDAFLSGVIDADIGPDGKTTLVQRVDEAHIWAWMREMLINRPEYAAKMTGIPELAALRYLPIPKPALKLARLLEIYKAHADIKLRTKQDAECVFKSFMEITGADTLADLTTEVLAKYRDAIKARVNSPAAVGVYFGRVKFIIKFAKSEGQDTVQIDAALSRMAILKAPKDTRVHQPTPISREDFHKLCRASTGRYADWQPRLLVMLNCCLHFGEAMDVKWSDFDLEAGTFCSKRNKRGRVIRAATLWPETLAAIKSVDRTGSPYVFVSSRGTSFNPKGQWQKWEKLRQAAGCPKVQLDDIRDGSYSAACTAPGVDEKYARLLAGHRSHGLQDNYVARNPALVKPASDAVYVAYGPFAKRK